MNHHDFYTEMKHFFLFFFLVIYNVLSLSAQSINKTIPIIPVPNSIDYGGGTVECKVATIYIQKAQPELKKLAVSYAALFGNPNIPIKETDQLVFDKAFNIYLMVDERRNQLDRYKIQIIPKGIIIEASRPRGIFYALQSITQLADLNPASDNHVKLPVVIIEDEPRFAYRGMHLDVARHFFPVDFIKKYIDLLARYKYNTFHWHLTDDQGWRIEIKKYPELTNIGAYRKETLVGHYTEFPVRYDGKEYGGFYTQDQIREIVAYARDRYIDVIPEIEMPGHASAALAAYPEFGCTKGPYKVETTWGVFPDVFCAKDTSIEFIKNILDEVCELFPSKYIHIGGDECPKERWKTCPECQKTMKRHQLNNEDQLQSYFIKNIEKHILLKGKQIIGWDEILEGGLAPQATVMSWRGVKGGIEAAHQNHQVIMCPGSHCYFDHYQSSNAKEALAIGGYTPISKVYDYEPVPDNLESKYEHLILGAQGNVWTEYMSNERKVIYMAFPRAIALSEVLWSKKSNRNYAKFLERLDYQLTWFKSNKMNLTNAFADLSIQTTNATTGTTLHFLKPPVPGKILLEYFENNDYHQEYPQGDSVSLNKNVDFKAWYQLKDNTLTKPMHIVYQQHEACGKNIVFETEISDKYSSGGKQCVVNGIAAPINKFSGPEWLGFEGTDCIAIIDLEKTINPKSVKIQTYHAPSSWVHRPKNIIVEASVDGKNFEPLSKWSAEDVSPSRYIEANLISNTTTMYRYLKIRATNHGIIEEGQAGAGHKSWLFIGEITVE